MLFLDPERLDERRAAAAGPLAGLSRGLTAELEPLLRAGFAIPREKARMTRIGGRCPNDGTPLDFDPWSPRLHRCPRCAASFARDEDYRWWIMSFHLWLAERAVHGALLHLLLGDTRAGALADDVLARCAERYLDWPNADNVLGPTRPFFSTYLESIWLLQLCVALDLREAAGAPAGLGATVRDRLIAPSRALIAGYDEGLSNRQTWNAAALLASALVLGDRRSAEAAVRGRSGLVAHLERGLLPDGSWYEGENYHLFAHRALWYGVTMAERAGLEVPARLRERFEEGFAAPFATALPDFTFPSRRDSQYGVSLRQWRFAELGELGLARRDDPRLTSALDRLYAPGLPRGETGRARSTADVEHHRAPTALARADLGWKSLLLARAELPPLVGRAPRSVLLGGQGLAVLRRDAGAVFVALDYGHAGGGHGHPDRLNLLLVDGGTRWLDDYGTGSYVERSLHWYRSTLAHNAPLVNGRSQEKVAGRLRAFEERGGAGWVCAAVAGAAPGAHLERTVVVMPDYLVDVLTWTIADGDFLDLPLHADGELAGARAWEPWAASGGHALEDGFDFLERAERAGASLPLVRLDAVRGDGRASVWIAAPEGSFLWRAEAPGAPGQGTRRFHAVRTSASRGRIVSVWSWRNAVAGVEIDDARISATLTDGARHLHARTAQGWHVELLAGSARSSIDLGGLRAEDDAAPPPVAMDAAPPPVAIPRVRPGTNAVPRAFELGEQHYRRSESSWREAGEPSANVRLHAEDDVLRLDVEVRKGAPVFRRHAATNPLDNEHPDVNSDGVQVHLREDGGPMRGWLMVPESPGTGVRVSVVPGTPPGPSPEASWRTTASGYLVSVRLPLSAACAGRFALDVLVNETAPERERRRGQLVLSGGRDEFVYLRGDRQQGDRLIPFVLVDA